MTGSAPESLELSVVIPTLNATSGLLRTVASLGAAAREIIVVDGGSVDGTIGIAERLGARVVRTQRGRGCQIAAGIAAAVEPWVLLLHADTRLAPGWVEAAAQHLAQGRGRAGYFRFVLDSGDPRARRLERMMSWRCRRWALPYGDQGLLISKELLDSVGGMRPLVLMEDVDLARRLGRARLTPLAADAVTSAARWERDGWLRRSARNLLCLALWRAGVPPSVIARIYA